MLSIAAAISKATSIWGNLLDNMTSAKRAGSMLTHYYIYGNIVKILLSIPTLLNQISYSEDPVSVCYTYIRLKWEL
jgi:hypothetical protein